MNPTIFHDAPQIDMKITLGRRTGSDFGSHAGIDLDQGRGAHPFAIGIIRFRKAHVEAPDHSPCNSDVAPSMSIEITLRICQNLRFDQ